MAIDKLEKIGLEAVKAELRERGIEEAAIEKLQPILELSGSNGEKLDQLQAVIGASETGLRGIEEMRTIFGYLEQLAIALPVELDLSLARGLNYYTGAIFEVKANDFAIGSICGGGRYDDLTGIFGLPNTSGVGISFGADRIYDVLNQLDLYPQETVTGTKLLFINFGEKETAYCMPIARLCREAGIATEVYADSVKMKKQMSYANALNIPFVALAGENEMNEGKVTLKNMATGEQSLVTPEELIAAIC